MCAVSTSCSSRCHPKRARLNTTWNEPCCWRTRVCTTIIRTSPRRGTTTASSPGTSTKCWRWTAWCATSTPIPTAPWPTPRRKSSGRATSPSAASWPPAACWTHHGRTTTPTASPSRGSPSSRTRIYRQSNGNRLWNGK